MKKTIYLCLHQMELINSNYLLSGKREKNSRLIRVIQFGEGNFIRGFVDAMLQVLDDRGVFGGSVMMVKPRNHGGTASMDAQQGVFTLIERGIVDGKRVWRSKIISVVEGCLHPYRQWDSLLALAGEPECRFIFSNTTESGLEYRDEPWELAGIIEAEERCLCPFSQLTVGLKCGGSDAFSGLTANPLVGHVSDDLAGAGVRLVMGEVPEMFGGETVLLKQCENAEIFGKGFSMIESYKDYFIKQGCPPEANPSPGNKAGGITTLEEKSLGCIKKAGSVPIRGILDMGDICEIPGLNLLRGPGNDAVAITLLVAAGSQVILFTTGRGTPLGGTVPTIKISSRTELAEKKPHWIDVDAGRLVSSSVSVADCVRKLEDFLVNVATGQTTCNERNDCREIALYKAGVTL